MRSIRERILKAEAGPVEVVAGVLVAVRSIRERILKGNHPQWRNGSSSVAVRSIRERILKVVGMLTADAWGPLQ